MKILLLAELNTASFKSIDLRYVHKLWNMIVKSSHDSLLVKIVVKSTNYS